MTTNVEMEFENKREFVRKVLRGDERAILLFNQSYDAAIARFMKLKETFVDKIMHPGNTSQYDLLFDLQSSRKLLWDLLFFAEIIKYECSFDINKYNNLENAFLLKKASIKFTDNKVSSLLSDNAMEVLSYASGKTLEDVLIEAICIFDSVRNSFGHNENNANCNYDPSNNKVVVKNSNRMNYLDVSFDFSYLSDFGNGIKPLKEHTEIKEVVDYNNSEIFRKMGFKIRDNLDIFYRTAPDRFSYLMDLVNNNYEALLDLPTILFSSLVDESRIELLLGPSRDIKRLNEFPSAVFIKKCSKESLLRLSRGKEFSLIKDCDKELITEQDLNIIKKCSNNVFSCDKSSYIVLDYLLEHGLDVIDINNYPSGIFFRGVSLDKVKYFVELDGENNLSNLIGINDHIFSGVVNLDRIKKVVKHKEDIHYLNELPYSIFTYNCISYKWDYIFSKDNPIEYFTKLPEAAFLLSCRFARFKYLLENFTIDELSVLPAAFFSVVCADEKFFYLVNNSSSIVDLYGISDKLLLNGIDLGLVKKFAGKNNVISRLCLIPDNLCGRDVNFQMIKYIFNIPKESDEEIIDYIFDNPNILESISKIPSFAFCLFTSEQLGENDKENFEFYSSNFKVLEYLIGEEKDYTRLYGLNNRVFFSSVSVSRLEYIMGPEKNIERLRMLCLPKYSNVLTILLDYRVSLDKITRVCGRNLDFDRLLNVSLKVFYMSSYEFISEVLDIINDDCDIFSSYSHVIFYDTNLEKTKYFLSLESDYKVLKFLPRYLFCDDCSLDRIKAVMKSVDNDFGMFSKMPKEVFFCADEIFPDLLKNFSAVSVAVQKSIFGLNDDKVISLIIYMNSLFNIINPAALKKSELNTECFDFESIQGIEPSYIQDVSVKVDALLSDDEVLNNTLEKYSFTKYFKNVAAMSHVELLRAYKVWEREVKNILYSCFRDLNLALLYSARNSFDHLRYDVTDIGKIKLIDSINRYEVDPVGQFVKKTDKTFEATVSCDKLFNFASSIQDQWFGVPYSLEPSVKKKIVSTPLLISQMKTKAEFEMAFSAFQTKIEDFIEKTKKIVISLCYLKEKKNVTNVKAVYMSSAVTGIHYVDDVAGAKAVKFNVFWNDFISNSENLEYEELVRQRML